MQPIIDYLNLEAKVRGISIFRAVSGYGESGHHLASLIDLSLNLPLIIEFFDEPEKTKQLLVHLSGMVKPEHLVFWQASANGS